MYYFCASKLYKTFISMMNLKFLLPHFMQYVGLFLFLIGVVGLCFAKADYVFFFSYLLVSVGLLLVAISKEKVEDEYMAYLRVRTVFILAVLALVYGVISPIANFLLVRMLDFSTVGKISIIRSVITGLPFVVGLYLLLFKGAIIVNTKSESLS